MNPFFNPIILSRVISYYLRDINRVWRYSPGRLRKYREKQFKKVLKLAMKTPLYREKYAGIDIDTITLDSIDKLPILTKADIRKHFPEGIVPDGYDIKKALVVSTSGSTGQPTSIYTDFYTIIKALMGFIREIREYDIHWRKDKMTIIADMTSGSAEEAYLNKTAVPNLKAFFSMDNMQLVHVGDPVEEMVECIDGFGPRFIGGYPGALRALAVLKRRGLGGGICPDVIASSGAVLDEYTRRYIEESFGCRVFDVYGSTEAGPVAFECGRGRYHVHSDLVHVEFLGEGLCPVDVGCAGRIVVTKLYGRATPVIRYDGLNDFVVPLSDSCKCGINSQIIEHVAGRMVDSLIMPSGKIIPPFAISGIPSKVMQKFKSFSLDQFQIVQENYTKINVYLVLNDSQLDRRKLFYELENEFKKYFEEETTVTILETDKIEHDGLIPKVIKSKILLK